MASLTLRCWCCGKEARVEGPIQSLGLNLLEEARKAGFLGVLDHHYKRLLVFCSDECLGMCKTKHGTIRLQPPNPPAN